MTVNKKEELQKKVKQRDIYLALAAQYLDELIVNVEEIIRTIDGLNKKQAYESLPQVLKKQLLRVYRANLFFDDAGVIERENEELAIMIREKESMISIILEEYLRKHRTNLKGVSYSVMARMLYVTTNEISIDIVKIKDENIREEYIQALANFIVNYVYES